MITNLRMDPYERGLKEGGEAMKFFGQQMWLLVPIQGKIKEFFADFDQFPYQTGSSLNAGGINYGLLAPAGCDEAAEGARDHQAAVTRGFSTQQAAAIVRRWPSDAANRADDIISSACHFSSGSWWNLDTSRESLECPSIGVAIGMEGAKARRRQVEDADGHDVQASNRTAASARGRFCTNPIW